MHDLVLLRHGHALSTGEAGVTCDDLRPLSERGIEEARSTAQHLWASGFRPELIIASPFARAAATADLAAELFPLARRLSTETLSDGNAAGLVSFLNNADLGGDAGLLVVGHQPLMGFLAGFFLAREAFPLSPAGFVRLKTGSAGFAPAPAGTLIEHYTPAGIIF
ncbi:MAG TPA: histidine phosphatase family protein [Elusimicrobiales bacterium]|nr:histidine phosphatase family protein [Elusimicrobiales bacterium]